MVVPSFIIVVQQRLYGGSYFRIAQYIGNKLSASVRFIAAGEAADILDEEAMHLLQYFTVDDLNFLKRTGRVSGASAAIGTVLNIKPLLWGDATGHIVACGKYRGRKKVMEAIVEMYRTRAIHPENQRVAITHGDCPQEAEQLAQLVREVCPPKELIVCPHEPFTGAHVGPGMLALFFFGQRRDTL